MVRKSVYDRLTDLLIDLVSFPSDDLSLESTWIRGLNYTISTKRTKQFSIFEIYPLHSYTVDFMLSPPPPLMTFFLAKKGRGGLRAPIRPSADFG